tara:strand:- start:243 stop:1160 length:918 start_codon:yes stop_codon:yes gene_type:complete
MEARINRRKFVVGASCSLCGSLILPSCTQVPLTNRSQLNLYDSNLPIVIFQGSVGGIPIPKVYANEKSLNKEIDKVYDKFLSKAKTDKILLDNTDESKKIEEVGKEIYSSINRYYLNKGEKNPVDGFNWKFALIESEAKNAWCMPGGKIAFYTGILPVCKNDDGIAAVMGHEIAHAFARHTVEKLTQSSMIQMATIGISNSRYAELLNKSFRVGNVGGNVYNSVVKYGIFLPFSRTMESEADYLGMGFMNLAGFNIKEPSLLWKRMMEDREGKMPEFMGSHPSPENRSKKFLEWENEIIGKFPTV